MKQTCAILLAMLLLPGVHYVLAWHGLTLAASCIVAFAATAQMAAYLVVFIVFARSLKSGHTPLIARLASITRGTLTPELVIYTKRVTISWCIFCLAQMAMPLALWIFAPPLVLIETAMNLPLVAGMVAAEYVYRLIRYHHIRHESPADMVRLVKQLRGMIRSS